MQVNRRELFAYAVSTTALGTSRLPDCKDRLYGLISKMTASPGQREALIAILIEAAADMPGCLNYIVAQDSTDENAIWITEAWDSQASHDASLLLPSVKNAITKARPMIAGFEERIVTTPIGGYGLTSSKAR